MHGELSGIFDKQLGKKVGFVCENDFAKQAQMHLDGKIKALRGTTGMINAAASVFEKAGSPLVVIYQSTWSTGGDCIVARGNIGTPADLEGKTIGLQRHGPHVNYVATLLTLANVDLTKVKFKWLKELTIPDPAAARTNDPVTAFQEDKSLDAIMCIIPGCREADLGWQGGHGSRGIREGRAHPGDHGDQRSSDRGCVCRTQKLLRGQPERDQELRQGPLAQSRVMDQLGRGQGEQSGEVQAGDRQGC